MFSNFLLRINLVLFLVLSIICSYVGFLNAQGLMQQTPYSASDTVRRGSSGPLDQSPSNPLALPRSSSTESDSIPLSSGLFQGLLPNIPNLQLGYIYNFGPNVRAGRATVDYLLPVTLSNNSTIFGELHGEFQSFWKTLPGSSNNRTDLSLGGGYRRMLGSKALVGINGFYDTSRLYRNWYSSGSVGVELAAEVAGNDAIDLNFNWYGRLFNSDVLSNAFRCGPSNYDFQIGYSHELWNNGPDLRLSGTGYKFDVGSNVYGYYGGAELKSRDGMFVLKSNFGYDWLNQTYYTVAGFLNMGFQLEDLLSGKNPLTMPEPIFKSPRNLRRLLTKTANRNWYQPTSVVVNRNYVPTSTTPTPTPDPPTPTCNSFCRTAPAANNVEIYPYRGTFIEGEVLYTELTNACCISVSFDWINENISYTPADVAIIIGPGINDWKRIGIVYLSGDRGTAYLNASQVDFTGGPNPQGLFLAFAGRRVSINNVVICFNKSCD